MKISATPAAIMRVPNLRRARDVHRSARRFTLLMMIVLVAPATAQVDFDFEDVGGKITITRYIGPGGAVVIPETINGLPVTILGNRAFVGSGNLTAVTIPGSVTRIGDETFWSRTHLSSVTLPNSLLRIGARAFQECSSLTNITIPRSVLAIGNGAFDECTNMNAFAVDPLNISFSSLDGVLFDKWQHKLIQCPSRKVGGYTIPNTVTSIETEAFGACARLTEVTIPNTIRSIPSFAFWECAGLTSVNIPDSVTNIGVAAFAYCTGLVRVTIPNSVTTLQSGAFDVCTSLTHITLPKPITLIDAYTFGYCDSLAAIYCQGDAPEVLSWTPGDFAPNATIYYVPGTKGWGPTLGPRPTAPWKPAIQVVDASLGVPDAPLGFMVTWASDKTVVVEACMNLANPTWLPVSTITLAESSFYFSDPQSMNYPGRFYRLRSQ